MIDQDRPPTTEQASASPRAGRRSGPLATLAPVVMFVAMAGFGLALLFSNLSPFKPIPVLFCLGWLALLGVMVTRWLRRRAGLGPELARRPRTRWETGPDEPKDGAP
ncbi:MAG: hypothetical protein AAFR93_15385 [Pseudomonadota bacterium]